MISETVTKKDIEKYYEKLIQCDLSLPFNSKIHQRMLYNLKGVSQEKRDELKSKIWSKFHEEKKNDRRFKNSKIKLSKLRGQRTEIKNNKINK